MKTLDKIGWFGCAHVDRVLSVEPRIPGSYPQVLDVTCPAGWPHRRQHISWRLRKPGEVAELRPDT